MATKQDVEMADTTAKVHEPSDFTDLLQTNYADAFAFSETEKLALELYDQMRELELQISLLRAQQDGTSPARARIIHSCTDLPQSTRLVSRHSQMMKCRSS
jgi:hypothetical protein